MPRPNRDRNRISPCVVRWSAGERDAMKAKAKAAGLTLADAARAAFADWAPFGAPASPAPQPGWPHVEVVSERPPAPRYAHLGPSFGEPRVVGDTVVVPVRSGPVGTGRGLERPAVIDLDDDIPAETETPEVDPDDLSAFLDDPPRRGRR